MSLLSVSGLTVDFGALRAVRGISFAIERGQTLALVGESGSGKSMSAMAILRLVRAARVGGSVQFAGLDLSAADEATLRRVRGDRIATIFQEPMTSLNPLHTVERQIGETLSLHAGLRGAGRRRRILELLEQVGLDRPEDRLGAFPHQLSGGQRQRVMIAMALANRPDLLIADEPTTALDVTIQAQILALLKRLQAETGMAMLFITHDLSIVRDIADRVAVMTEGQIVETGPTADVLAAPQHAYTRRLLAAQPRPRRRETEPGETVLAATDLRVWFPIRAGLLRRTRDHIRAVDAVTLSVRRGETLGIVGESGSGKTTLGRALLRLIASDGEIVALGQTLSGRSWRALRPLRADVQIVFQDPFGSLSPRLPVGEVVAEGLKVHRPHLAAAARDALVATALTDVGLDPETRFRYPHEFSGGQRQRVAIARALVLEPQILVLDEPTSALDMTVQAQIVDLLADLQRQRALTYLFISHDLRVVRALADRILVMRDGRIIEEGPAEEVVAHPRQAYTRALMQAAFGLAGTGQSPPQSPDPRR